MFEVLIQPTFAYNDLEREMQVLEFSYLVRDENKNTIVREDLTFQPILGVDESLLLWLGIRDKVCYSNTAKGELSRITETINSKYSNCKLISWYNELQPLPLIESKEVIVMYNTVRKNMNQAYKSEFNEELQNHHAKHKLDVMLRIYDKLFNREQAEEGGKEAFPTITTSVFEI